MSKVRAVVTGADGFIGSHLTELLVLSGYKVKALSQYNSFNNWGWLEDINCKDQIEILTGDIRDSHYCKLITKDVYMDCMGKLEGGKILDVCGICGGSGPQYHCERSGISYCTEAKYQLECTLVEPAGE